MKSRDFPIYIILGTRAQFIKMAPVMYEMKERGVDYTLIYTSQHKENILEILEIYELAKPDIIMFVSDEANTISKASNWTAKMFYHSLCKARKYLSKKGIVLIHGDTFSTWLGALMGRIAGCRVAHVESGLRSFNIFNPFPEEISRLITFTLSNVYFCGSEWSVNNLKRYQGEKININGNTLIDAIRFALNKKKKHEFYFQETPFALVSMHRSENLFTQRFIDFIIPTIQEISILIKLVFTLHPSTRERLKQLNLIDQLNEEKNIILHDRFNFIDWITLCNKAEFVLTDGGSNQEELSYLGVPTLLFREKTERLEGLDENVVLSKFNKDIVTGFINNYRHYRRNPIIPNHSPSKKIVDYIVRNHFEK